MGVCGGVGEEVHSRRLEGTRTVSGCTFQKGFLNVLPSHMDTEERNVKYSSKSKFVIARIACWLERRTRDRKGASSNPGRSGGRVFSSRVITLIRCPLHPRVSAVARKRPRSFCQKCR